MERDDLIVNDSYALNAHHSEEEGVKIRKKIAFVTILLTLITAVEVGMGIIFKRAETFTWETIKWTFIVMTLVKAGYIVMIFMHLGDEKKNLRKSLQNECITWKRDFDILSQDIEKRSSFYFY